MDDIYEAIERADVLAHKSRWLFVCYGLYCALGVYFILGDIWTFFTNIHNISKTLVMTVVMGVAGVLFFVIGIRGVLFYFNAPDGPVRADENYLYVFRGEWWEYVSYSDIKRVSCKGFGAGSADGDGALIIETETARVKIICLHNVNEARVMINLKMTKPE